MGHMRKARNKSGQSVHRSVKISHGVFSAVQIEAAVCDSSSVENERVAKDAHPAVK